MEVEMDALQQNITWELVARPKHTNGIESKWIYKIKYNENRDIDGAMKLA